MPQPEFFDTFSFRFCWREATTKFIFCLSTSQFCGLHMGPRPPGYAYTTKFIMLVHTIYTVNKGAKAGGNARACTHTLTPRLHPCSRNAYDALCWTTRGFTPRFSQGQKDVDGRTVGKHLLFTVLRGLTEIYSQVVR